MFVSAPPSSYGIITTFDNRNLQPINLDNNKFLPVVAKFIYLCTKLYIEYRDNEDVAFRVKKSGNAFGALRKYLFSNSNISVVAKRDVYKKLLFPILLYGAECWCLTEKIFSMLHIQDLCVQLL